MRLTAYFIACLAARLHEPSSCSKNSRSSFDTTTAHFAVGKVEPFHPHRSPIPQHCWRASRRGLMSRPEPIELMTLGAMRQLGVRSLAASCHKCHHEMIIEADQWLDRMQVPSFGPQILCSKCGTVGADVRPNWREVCR
jgi:hypothetical protein